MDSFTSLTFIDIADSCESDFDEVINNVTTAAREEHKNVNVSLLSSRALTLHLNRCV